VEYVGQIWTASSSREVILAGIGAVPGRETLPGQAGGSEEETLLRDFALHLSASGRWAVMAPDPLKGIRDFYVAPLSSSADYQLMGNAMRGFDLKENKDIYLLGILVVANEVLRQDSFVAVAGNMVGSHIEESYDPVNKSALLP
jgi:hypothetical protein